MAHATDDRAQAERYGPRRPPRLVSPGAQAARRAGAGRSRADTEQCDRIPGIAGEARSPRSRPQADASEDGHANLRGAESARRRFDWHAYRGEFAQTAATAAKRSRASRHARKRDSRVWDSAS